MHELSKIADLLLVPPFTGRLHCGEECVEVEHHGTASRTALHRAAPLRPGGRRDRSSRLVLVPPFTGRLHCGERAGYPFVGGGPLSYRPSPGGSIAAGAFAPQAPRSDPARTALHRAAPLRQVPGPNRRPASETRTALHRAAPLRLDIPACGQQPRRRLVPPFTGRLHCGRSHRWDVTLEARSRTALHRAAPLRPGSNRVVYIDELASRTALHRAAPLRRLAPARAHARHGPLVPPFTGRLHCGLRNRTFVKRTIRLSYRPSPGGSIAAATSRAAGRQARLVPPFTGRLHCGRRRPVTPGSCSRLVPPFTGRLHCGQSAKMPYCHSSGGSYRPSPGGSIAASTAVPSHSATRPRLVPPFTGRLHCGPVLADCGSAARRSYRPSPGGSIAASRGAGRSGTGCILVPPFTGRLHCGVLVAGFGRSQLWLVPPFTGRLHCGVIDDSGTVVPTRNSYRPSPGGSIAASRRHVGLSGSMSSYRPSPGGSIAAIALHMSVTRGGLVPPFTGRLHCGGDVTGVHHAVHELVPPFTGRLFAAPRCGAGRSRR